MVRLIELPSPIIVLFAFHNCPAYDTISFVAYVALTLNIPLKLLGTQLARGAAMANHALSGLIAISCPQLPATVLEKESRGVSICLTDNPVCVSASTTTCPEPGNPAMDCLRLSEYTTLYPACEGSDTP